MKQTFADRGKFMYINWPFELFELCRPGTDEGKSMGSSLLATGPRLLS